LHLRVVPALFDLTGLTRSTGRTLLSALLKRPRRRSGSLAPCGLVPAVTPGCIGCTDLGPGPGAPRQPAPVRPHGDRPLPF